MKKLIALLLALVLVVGLVACGGKKTDTDKPAGDDTDKPAGDDTAKGSVYYLNFKPEADAAWQEFAKAYTEKTGVEVKVVTAASGSYDSTLSNEMAKDGAPTLFQCGNAIALENWSDYTLDLTDAEFVKALTSSNFTMNDADGKVKAVAYCTETYGIIVNTKLLGDAGYTLDQIKDFASLKTIAEDIHARAAELGFDAFAAAGLDGSSSWRFSGHLTNMPLFYEFRDNNVTGQPATVTGAYMNNYRNIWDLYINNSAVNPVELTTATGDMSQAEFGTGKAVFWQQGTWEYANLIGEKYNMDPANLEMIPIYCGVEGEENSGLCTGSENYWCVNAKSSEADIKATLEFLNYVVTSEEGLQLRVDQFGAVPFKNAPEVTNIFANDGVELVNAGKYPVTWAFTVTPNVDSWRAGIVPALAAYSADQTDDNWQKVVDAYVTGWAIEYNAQG